MATRPVIMTVDDDPQVLAAVERDLRQHYRSDYRIVRSSSGAEALSALRELKQRGVPVALFLVDQRMPEMTGTEFRQEALKLEPDAKKVLLTAYADTQAAIDSINKIGLDFYLQKPWDPPDQFLYPILDDLLSDWVTSVVLPYEGIRVAGMSWSVLSHNVKDFLARNRIPYRFLDVEKDDQTRALVEALPEAQRRLPVVFLPDGTVLANPDERTLAERAGLRTRAEHPFYDVIIIGGGPAGLAAAVCAASEGLRTALIERYATGGQAGMSGRIENYMGFPKGVSGGELAQRATVQATRFGSEILTSVEATRVRLDEPYKYVTLSNGTELGCKALIMATGMTVNKLPADGVDRLVGAGVYYGAAVTEAVTHQGEHVFVIGGANSAGQGAVTLSRYARQVTVVVRRPFPNQMSQYLRDQIAAIPNIDYLVSSEVLEAHGERRLEAITVENVETGERQKLQAGGMFIFIGAVPHSDLVKDLVQVNEKGFIVTGPDLMKNGQRPPGWKPQRDPYFLETSVPGIFAVGDVRLGLAKRVTAAVGDGGIAVSFIHHYLRSI